MCVCEWVGGSTRACVYVRSFLIAFFCLIFSINDYGDQNLLRKNSSQHPLACPVFKDDCQEW